MNSSTLVLGTQVLVLSLPIYFFSKRLEKKINPRKSLKHFAFWFLAVIIVSFIWFAAAMYFYTKIYFPNWK